MWFTSSTLTRNKINLRARQLVARPAVKKLQKSIAVQEDMEDEKASQQPSATYWEELQDVFFKKKYQRARHASMESFLEDENECKINLSKMYRENSSEDQQDIPPDVVDSLEYFIKSFEEESFEEESPTKSEVADETLD